MMTARRYIRQTSFLIARYELEIGSRFGLLYHGFLRETASAAVSDDD
jgi:hypothetical protein